MYGGRFDSAVDSGTEWSWLEFGTVCEWFDPGTPCECPPLSPVLPWPWSDWLLVPPWLCEPPLLIECECELGRPGDRERCRLRRDPHDVAVGDRDDDGNQCFGR